MSKLTGQSIGRYHILEQLGEGGMATVYKAYDTRLERNVAVKVLRTDQFIPAQLQMILQRFEREAKSLAKLKHSNIVNILDFGDHEGMPYLVMEFIPGGTLKQKLGHAIPWREAIHKLLPVARGLSYAHQHSVIHRDVKPANILIDENQNPILTDFGIAKLLEGASGHTLTGSGVGIGTPEYMAPEKGIGAGTIDGRADIYSLGIVLYEMITGRKPYLADTPMAVVLKQITDPLPSPTEFVPDLPEDIEHILFKALAKQPEDRYTDMNSLIGVLESVLIHTQDIEASASPKQVKKKAALRTSPSPKSVITVIGTLAIVLATVFGIPQINQQFYNAPAVQATSTSVAFLTSISTLLPHTATLALSPLPTLTSTSRPTITNTPAPTWVTNFANPILAAIKDRQPDFQDDFSIDTKRWYPFTYYGYDSTKSLMINEGVMRLRGDSGFSNYYFLHKPDMVLQVDVLNPIIYGVAVLVESQSFESEPDYIQLNPDNQWDIHGHQNLIANGQYKADGQKKPKSWLL